MKPREYTDEQLSRIPSACAAGQLVQGGRHGFALVASTGIGCLNQMAYNEPDRCAAAGLNEGAAFWFDHLKSYEAALAGDPDRLLRALERIGVA